MCTRAEKRYQEGRYFLTIFSATLFGGKVDES